MDEDNLELCEKTKKDIQKAREEVKKGKLYSLEEVKNEMKQKSI